MEKLAIFDYATGMVDIYPTEYDNKPNMDKLLEELGHNANYCCWMFTHGDITFHKETLKQCK